MAATSSFPDETKDSTAVTVPYGFLALLHLVKLAACDRRVTLVPLRVLNNLTSYSGADGTCFISTSTIAKSLGITRQVVQRAIWELRDLGYLADQRRWKQHGGETTKIFTFNLDLVRAEPPPGHVNSYPGPPAGDVVGLHPDRGAEGRTAISVQGAHPLEGAQRNHNQDTNLEETTTRDIPDETTPSANPNTSVSSKMQAITQMTEATLPPGNATIEEPPKRNQETLKAALRRANEWDTRKRQEAGNRMAQDLIQSGRFIEVTDAIPLGEGHPVYERALAAERRRPGNGVKYLIAAVTRKGRN